MKLIKKHDKQYFDFLKNKNVAIVGPATSVMFSENGDFLESHDVLIRVNQGLKISKNNKAFLGNRTDVLYNSLDFHINSGGNLFKEDLTNIEFICCPYPTKEGTFTNLIFNKFEESSLFEKYKIRFIRDSVYYDAKSESNSRINTGFGAILDLLQHDLKSLYITGIDFYRSEYVSGYKPYDGTSVKEIERDLQFKQYLDSSRHHPDRQYKLFKKIIKEDNRVKLDDFMKKITQDQSYDCWDSFREQK